MSLDKVFKEIVKIAKDPEQWKEDVFAVGREKKPSVLARDLQRSMYAFRDGHYNCCMTFADLILGFYSSPKKGSSCVEMPKDAKIIVWGNEGELCETSLTMGVSLLLWDGTLLPCLRDVSYTFDLVGIPSDIEVVVLCGHLDDKMEPKLHISPLVTPHGRWVTWDRRIHRATRNPLLNGSKGMEYGKPTDWVKLPKILPLMYEDHWHRPLGNLEWFKAIQPRRSQIVPSLAAWDFPLRKIRDKPAFT